jgi:hypothetical protein
LADDGCTVANRNVRWGGSAGAADVSDFRTLKRTSLLYSSALFLLSPPGVTGRIPGLDVKGVSAGFALLALALAASYYFAEFDIAWYRQIQPELRKANSWRAQTGDGIRVAIHNFRNAVDHHQRCSAELGLAIEGWRQAVERQPRPKDVAIADLRGSLLNAERSANELAEFNVMTRDRLSEVYAVARGLLVFGAVTRAQLFWFDLVWPAVLFVAALLHFLGHYPPLALAPSLPDLLSGAALVPVIGLPDRLAPGRTRVTRGCPSLNASSQG